MKRRSQGTRAALGRPRGSTRQGRRRPGRARRRSHPERPGATARVPTPLAPPSGHDCGRRPSPAQRARRAGTPSPAPRPAPRLRGARARRQSVPRCRRSRARRAARSARAPRDRARASRRGSRRRAMRSRARSRRQSSPRARQRLEERHGDARNLARGERLVDEGDARRSAAGVERRRGGPPPQRKKRGAVRSGRQTTGDAFRLAD